MEMAVPITVVRNCSRLSFIFFHLVLIFVNFNVLFIIITTGSEASRHGRSKSMTAYTGNLSFQHMGLEDDGDGNDGLVVSDRDCVLIGSKMSLFEFIVSRLDELRKEFEVQYIVCIASCFPCTHIELLIINVYFIVCG